ncbi:MAG: hypothetical protein ACRDT8_02020 [Micromonosporaceae bacterium]
MPKRTPPQYLDAARRVATRVLFLYELVSETPPEPAAAQPLTSAFDFGRFAPHLEAANRLLPRALPLDHVASDALGSGDHQLGGFHSLRLFLTITPRGDITLVLDGVLDGDHDGASIAALLATTCFERTALTVSGEPLLEWAARALSHSGTLRFGRDVHQIVFPGGALLDAALSATPTGHPPAVVSELVYRGTLAATDVSTLAVRTPRVLNNLGNTLVAHGRGVSVIAGWNEPAENTLGTGALLLVSALGVLQRARHGAFDALTRNERAMLGSPGDARALVSELSAHLNELQLDLSFGVEAYVDSVIIPDLVVEAFQSSLRDSMALLEGLENTSRMLERLHSVIQARLSALSATAQEQSEQRHRVFSLVLAVGSLIALPPSLLLAFFGSDVAEVAPGSSILDLKRYWPAYALAWLPFVALVLAGGLTLRRIGKGSRRLWIREKLTRSRLRPGVLDSEPRTQLASTDPVPRQRIAPRPAGVESGQPDRQGGE